MNSDSLSSACKTFIREVSKGYFSVLVVPPYLSSFEQNGIGIPISILLFGFFFYIGLGFHSSSIHHGEIWLCGQWTRLMDNGI